MRDLTAKQKKLLKKWYNEVEPTAKEKSLFNKINPLMKVEDLTAEQYEELQNINNTEILYQNVNSFLHDLNFN